MVAACERRRVTTDLSDDAYERVVKHVLREVHPDRVEGEVVGTAPVDGGLRVGVKVHPRSFFSTAKYALVTVDDEGQVVDSEACTGRELRRAVGSDGG